MIGRTILSLAAAVLCASVVAAPLFANSDTARPAKHYISGRRLAGSLRKSPLSDREKVLQVLNRLSFGPRPGDLERVEGMGIRSYIEEQFHPETIDDKALSTRLDDLKTLRMSSRELGAIVRREQEERAKAGVQGAKPSQVPNDSQLIVQQLAQAKLLRAAYSSQQLLEVMCDFWFNHFNVFIGKGADRVLTTSYMRDVIRPNALGSFRDLLTATAHSPAMLFYLDNWVSVSPNPVKPGTVRQRRGLNENYARELMELQTLGVYGGYTQKDVIEVARCFTGWTIDKPGQGGGFRFDEALHDEGAKIVLGKKIPAGGGIRDGERVLTMLAEHPSTARFISTKLCRRFVSDNPPQALVDACTVTFRRTHGDIRRVLATIFSSPEFYSRRAYMAKTKTPFELVVSALRATDADTDASPRLLSVLRILGDMPFACQTPNGYPDMSEAWMNAGALLERINFAAALAMGRIPGTTARVESEKGLDGALRLGSPDFQRR